MTNLGKEKSLDPVAALGRTALRRMMSETSVETPDPVPEVKEKDLKDVCTSIMQSETMKDILGLLTSQDFEGFTRPSGDRKTLNFAALLRASQLAKLEKKKRRDLHSETLEKFQAIESRASDVIKLSKGILTDKECFVLMSACGIMPGVPNRNLFQLLLQNLKKHLYRFSSSQLESMFSCFVNVVERKQAANAVCVLKQGEQSKNAKQSEVSRDSKELDQDEKEEIIRFFTKQLLAKPDQIFTFSPAQLVSLMYSLTTLDCPQEHSLARFVGLSAVKKKDSFDDQLWEKLAELIDKYGISLDGNCKPRFRTRPSDRDWERPPPPKKPKPLSRV